MNLKKLFWLIVPFFCIFFVSCGKSDNLIPEVYVNFEINLNFPQYKNLSIPGGYAYFSGGNAGIFVYNFNGTKFYAFDRACTENTSDTPLVFNEKTLCLNHSDTTENCNSQYNVLLHGAVSYGSAKYALKEYNTVYSTNSGILKVYNNIY